MPTTFELRQNDARQYYFNFLGSDGELILISGEYVDKDGARQAIKDVQVGSLMNEQIAAGKVPAGDSFFVIKDSAGQILVKSKLYSNRMQFDNALHTVKDNACIAEIIDQTATL